MPWTGDSASNGTAGKNDDGDSGSDTTCVGCGCVMIGDGRVGGGTYCGGYGIDVPGCSPGCRIHYACVTDGAARVTASRPPRKRPVHRANKMNDMRNHPPKKRPLKKYLF